MGMKRWEMSADFVPLVGDDGLRTDGKEWDRSCRDCLGYVKLILADSGWKRRNGKPLSEKSRTEYGNAIFVSFAELKELGYGLKKPWNLESPNIEALCRLWASRGLSAATVQNRLTSLSWLGALMSRPGLVRGTHSYDEQFGDVDMCRHQAATRDKSPEGSGFDRDEVIRIAMAVDETFGYMVMLQFATGMRNKEAVRARPLVDDCGDHWKLPPSVGGSKGGRARIIPLEQGTWQREALDRVKAFVRRKAKGRLKTPMGWSNGKEFESANGRICSGLKSDMNKYKALLEKCKFTRRQLGFTGHAMRHFFAHKQYEAHGFIAPVKVDQSGASGCMRHADDGRPVTMSEREEVKQVDGKVSESLGHIRPEITASYCGGGQKMKGTRNTTPDAVGVKLESEKLVTKADRDAIKAAQRAVSESLGHSRPSVTSAYYGKTKHAKLPLGVKPKPS